MTTLKAFAAIEYAEKNGLTLSKYNDDTEDAKDGLSVEDARKVAAEDPTLIYIEIEPTYTVVSARVCDDPNRDNVNELPSTDNGAAIVRLRRDQDGVEGDVYVMVGTPEHLIGTAQASGSALGLEDVWAFGDSLSAWCPEEFAPDSDGDEWDVREAVEKILQACRPAALKAWAKYDGPYATVEV